MSVDEPQSPGDRLDQVSGWEWYVEVGYSNGQAMRVPAADQERAAELMAVFATAAKMREWVRIDTTAVISAIELRYVQIGQRRKPDRVEPIGFATSQAVPPHGAPETRPDGSKPAVESPEKAPETAPQPR